MKKRLLVLIAVCQSIASAQNNSSPTIKNFQVFAASARLAVQGRAGNVYEVETSTDFRAWSAVKTVKALVPGFTVDVPIGGTRAFFRLKLVGAEVAGSYPTFILDPLPTSGLMDGSLLRFAVVAGQNGPVNFDQLSFGLTTTNAFIARAGIKVFTDALFSKPDLEVGVNGAGVCQVVAQEREQTINATWQDFRRRPALFVIPAGTARYVELSWRSLTFFSLKDNIGSTVTLEGADNIRQSRTR
ncbi:MAG: hypothetical protein HYV67_00625 [Candidatus Taylorbacteria bacterium]|nr:hypothetical protein [Candidatus Taylorbacteria bacterium]